MCIRMFPEARTVTRQRAARSGLLGLLAALAWLQCGTSRADTVASLLGNFTINQYAGLDLGETRIGVHFVVVYGQLPALAELHRADANGDGVTTQAERDAYVGTEATTLARGLRLEVDGVPVPLRATRWESSLPTEQGGFSLRIDVDYAGALPAATRGATHRLMFHNDNYPGRMGWHEVAVVPAAGVAAFDGNAYRTSLTRGLTEALRSLPDGGPLDERAVACSFVAGVLPPGAAALPTRATADDTAAGVRAGDPAAAAEPPTVNWLARQTRRLVAAISAPRVDPGLALLALLGAFVLGAVHALSPGHGKTIVGAYLIGSRGTARHAAFLGLTVTLTHTFGVFVLGFATLYASRYVVPEQLFPVLSLVSALLVLGMGLVLLAQRARAAGLPLSGARSRAPVFRPAAAPARGLGVLADGHLAGAVHAHADGTMHSHGGGPMHSHLPPGAAGERVTWRSLAALGISGGLVPCPSAMVLLLAAVAVGKTAYGMGLVVAFSVGLALTLTLVGLAFLYARSRLPRPRAGARWPRLLPVLSAGTITVLGLGLSVAALASFGAAGR
jgi:ABC-type nickel/cobalt efflux system permease component RcnA